MSVTIDRREADELLQAFIATTGEDASDAVTRALRERLARERKKRAQPQSLADELLHIGQECAALPILDDRTPDEILGHNENGAPA